MKLIERSTSEVTLTLQVVCVIKWQKHGTYTFLLGNDKGLFRIDSKQRMNPVQQKGLGSKNIMPSVTLLTFYLSIKESMNKYPKRRIGIDKVFIKCT